METFIDKQPIKKQIRPSRLSSVQSASRSTIKLTADALSWLQEALEVAFFPLSPQIEQAAHFTLNPLIVHLSYILCNNTFM